MMGGTIYPDGPHQRAGRARRRRKALLLALMFAGFSFVASVHQRPPDKNAGHRPHRPSPVYAANEVEMSPGLKDIYAQNFPDLARELGWTS